MTHRNNIEFIQVVFEAINLFIPGHGTLQTGHGMAAKLLVAGFHVDPQAHPFARGGIKMAHHLHKGARH